MGGPGQDDARGATSREGREEAVDPFHVEAAGIRPERADAVGRVIAMDQSQGLKREERRQAEAGAPRHRHDTVRTQAHRKKPRLRSISNPPCLLC